jgi:hypothetical protein
MTTPQPPSSSAATSRRHHHTVAHTAVVQAAAYLCAGGFVVGLLIGATTVAWLLLAAALTADTATYGLRACRDRTDRSPRDELHPSGFRVHRDEDAALLAPYRRETTITEIHGNRTHPLEERNDAPWRYRPLPQRR